MTDLAITDLNRDQARALTDKAKGVADELVPLIAELYRGRAWRALGYDSWDAYRRAEFPSVLVAVNDRPQTNAQLREVGMSQQERAAIMGVSRPTVSRIDADLSDGSSDGADEPSDTRTAMSGGRAYERRSPASPLAPKHEPVMLTLRTHTGEEVQYPKPAARATFNETTGEGISWAAWSWNPVTGCLHGCDYCYARAIAHRFTDGFPAGFTPLFHQERLEAPANTTVPAAHRGNPAYKRVFVCSMADLYGRWVPDEWIQQVHDSMLAAPWWEYLLLTKFPARYAGLHLPPNEYPAGG